MTNRSITEYTRFANRTAKAKKYLLAVLPIISLFVVIGVFWWLKLIGITMAGEAFCGMEEHTHFRECFEKVLDCSEEHEHSEECYTYNYICGMDEHIHDSTCYSDIHADVESAEDWEGTLPNLSEVNGLPDRIVAVAKSQLGYTESNLNFQVDAELVRRGYTRYGEWYGNPYGDWSNMFTAFCLRYSGADGFPANSGADAMQSDWEREGIFFTPDDYYPVTGDIIFLDKNSNGVADSTAVITSVNGTEITVIEGDVDGAVASVTYFEGSTEILGYGLLSPANNVLFMATPLDLTTVAQSVPYSSNIFSSAEDFLLYTVGTDGNYYAIDGNANAVRVYIDDNGNVSADVDDPNTLYWSFEYCGNYDNRTTYYMQNVATRMYLHPYINSSTDRGAILSGRWETALYPSGNGVKLRGARQNAYASLATNSVFTCMDNLNNGSVFYFAKAPEQCVVWLDGTNGGIMTYSGSLDRNYFLLQGSTMTLPTEWQSPAKYSYKLRGWYDVVARKYYLPGSQVTITQDTVFYADWVAATYDIGRFNSHTVNTTSTGDFVTVKVFDYGSLFNILSESVSVNITSSGHTETWSLLTSGNNPYNGEPTLDFIFRDWDRGSEDISYPQNHNNKNNPTSAGSVYSGLYTEELGELLFDPDTSFNPSDGSGVIGKQYLGEGDHLFQLMTDPESEHYGYYYYDSDRNAASYNQSENRFYVYNYLECTKDSATSNDAVGKYSDFLPLNSPYANTNGKNVATYTYDGTYGEYVGTNHCMYDAKYSDSNNSPNNVGANFWFGMSVDIDFYLPNSPGYRDADGTYGNKDLYGKDLHFKFSGDDDVWVLVDGELVLDLGGIHGVESGDVNFSSGIVTVNGSQSRTIYEIEPGEHVLTIYYLERGSSRSNCAIYFNLAPRFGLDIQKEDVLTRETLDGAQFSVFTDPECTVPAELWENEEAHNNSEAPTNVFTVENGVAKIWGFGAGNTYYIKETAAPAVEGYDLARGIICLTFDKKGVATFTIEIKEETNEFGDPIDVSNGFTVYGFKIDEDTKKAFIIVTNAQDWVTETTTVQAIKKWDDDIDHSGDYVTVYLTVTDPDGTVRRIREIVLGDENDWNYVWTSLPKYYSDGVTEVKYGIEEAYKSGYHATVEMLKEGDLSSDTWAEALTFENGKEYILKTNSGCLSTTSASASTLMWVDEQTAATYDLALWTATVNGNNVMFTNRARQILSFNYSSYSSSRYFYATNSLTSYQTFGTIDAGNGLRLYVVRSNRNYYFSSINSNNRGSSTTSSSSAAVFVPMTLISESVEIIGESAFLVTNTPLDSETSLTVNKVWDVGEKGSSVYEKMQITVQLYANGVFTGRTVTLNLQNGWSATFLGLPYIDNNGNVIQYTVNELIDANDWVPIYGEIITIEGDDPTYMTTITNSYRHKSGYLLPSTGGHGKSPWIFSGMAIMLISLIYGYVLRRKRKGGNSS